MKNLFIILSIALLAESSSAQTPVSGGIYSNTTWTLTNSPYVVTDAIVVFPNVILTIEPGVVVKFYDNTNIELRGSSLKAIGNLDDSIQFISNSVLPNVSQFNPIVFSATSYGEYKYCRFRNANRAIYFNEGSVTQILIDNCTFENNFFGFINGGNNEVYGLIQNSTFKNNDIAIGRLGAPSAGQFTNIKNCIFESNRIGVDGFGNNPNIYECSFIDHSEFGIQLVRLVDNCVISNNEVGISHPFESVTNSIITNNNIGVDIFDYIDLEFSCNNICNNSLYNVRLNSSSNLNLSNNCWCTSDSTQINQGIFNGYDDISLGISVTYPYLLCSPNMLNENCGGTGIREITEANHIIIYPNPSIGFFAIHGLPHNFFNATIKVTDIFGRNVPHSFMKNENENFIDLSMNKNGLYTISIFGMDGNLIYRSIAVVVR